MPEQGNEPPFIALVTYSDDDQEPTPRGIGTRNVGLIGAPDAGATTLAERMVRDAPAR